MATRQDEPAPGCRASQEQLLNSKDPLNIYDDCPMCEKLGVLCFVANHPSRPLLTSTGKRLLIILKSFCVLILSLQPQTSLILALDE